MSKEKTRDQQAFPVVGDISQIHDGGMTLQDYFAAKAMESMVRVMGSDVWSYASRRKRIAETAYKVSAEMMDARIKNLKG